MPGSKRPLPTSGWRRIVINFTPSWFSVNMGTGIISILLHTAPHQFPGLNIIATVFYVLNIALFTLFAAISILRYTLYPWIFPRMLRHPTQSLFLGTLPMGFATIVNATALIAVPAFGQWARDLAWAMWWVDVALALASCIGMPIAMFRLHTLSLESMSAIWLLPVVPAVVCAASGGTVAAMLPAGHALTTLLVSYMLWGMGMGLSFAIITLYIHRLAVYNLPKAEVIVSAFLPLGPFGQGAFGIMQIAKVGQRVFAERSFAHYSESGEIVFVVSMVVGLMLWGLGCWWFFHGASSVLIRMASEKLSFSIGFWSFVFPLGVFAAATIALAQGLASVVFSWVATVQIIALVILYFLVASGTLYNALFGNLIAAPCLLDLSEPAPPEA